ncbi:MAG TPA: hypothetical protein VK550_00565 [Polyangiaceae bacterium]|nr:hypothetical protein [Polyangiaceae bacterium]
MSSPEITFLPYLRRGLARALTNPDPLSGPLPRDVTITASIDIEGSLITQTVVLRGPGDATGLSDAQVLRMEPAPDALDVEENYFPLLELRAPDLPWLLTPACPAGGQKLRPWLVLIAVREQSGVTLRPGAGARLPVLTIAEPSAELPDLADSWAWVHVQSLIATSAIADAVASGSSEVFARLICPRRLLPRTGYRVCLVPAFEDGRLRGLGQPIPTESAIEPAWTKASLRAPIELPVYVSWRFTTGEGGDFEALCRRLEPAGDGAELGMHALDITAPGIVPASVTTAIVDMQGALRTLEATPRPWNKQLREPFQSAIRVLLNAGMQRATYDRSVTDPVVAPPSYGAWPAGAKRVPQADGWLRELNLDPVTRAAAGLGAAVVRANQEALVAGAWEQAGDLPATLDLLNRGRLAVEITRSLAARTASIEAADVLRLTSRLHPLLSGGSSSIATRLAESDVPNGLVSHAALRLTRRGTPLARDFAKRTGRSAARLGAEHLALTLAATGPNASALAPALRFAVHGLPSGAQTHDPTLEEQVVVPQLPGQRRGARHGLPSAARTKDPTRDEQVTMPLMAVQLRDAPRALSERYRVDAAALTKLLAPALSAAGVTQRKRSQRSLVAAATDVSELATSVRTRLDTASIAASVRAGLVARIPELAERLAVEALPKPLALAPIFSDPLSPDLIALASEWFMPGVSSLRKNRVRLVEVNATFVAAFLVGANCELARELVWRDYPVNVRATFFRRFWQYVDPERTDIADIASAWKPGQSLAENVAAQAAELTAIVVRGDLVRRYPTAHWFMQKAIRGEDGALVPEPGTVIEVAFLAMLDPQTAVFGFDVAPGAARGEHAGHGYYVGVEEQPASPRFGLDRARPAHFDQKPGSWDAASWGHLVASQAELDALTHARTDAVRLAGVELGGTTWGQSSAHQARATWQRPFRMLVHAQRLI